MLKFFNKVYTYTLTDLWFYNKYQCIFRKNNVYILFSGGFDSRVLLDLVVKSFKERISCRVFVVHINHGVTPMSSTWEQSCFDICYFLNIPILTIKNTLKKDTVFSENACRNLRGIVCNNFILAKSVIVTAHHSNDCVETVYQRLCRGVGSLGFSGIYYKIFGRKHLFYRPLLFVTKGTLRVYAAYSKVLWVEDYTNYYNLQYTRNYIRFYILKKFKRKFFTLVLSILKLTVFSLRERYNFSCYIFSNFMFVVGLTKFRLNISKLFSVTQSVRFWVVRFWIFTLFFYMFPKNFYTKLHYFLCKKTYVSTYSEQVGFFLFSISGDFLSIRRM